jgi:hypothetical protein
MGRVACIGLGCKATGSQGQGLRAQSAYGTPFRCKSKLPSDISRCRSGLRMVRFWGLGFLEGYEGVQVLSGFLWEMGESRSGFEGGGD